MVSARHLIKMFFVEIDKTSTYIFKLKNVFVEIANLSILIANVFVEIEEKMYLPKLQIVE